MLSDGSGSFNYSSGADCEWLIVQSSAFQIILSFTEFSTQKDSDVVQVLECYSMNCSDSRQLAQLSGTYLNKQVFLASTSIMKVTFTSDESITGSGFSAIWNLVSHTQYTNYVSTFNDSVTVFSTYL
jgi:hypothetical protein